MTQFELQIHHSGYGGLFGKRTDIRVNLIILFESNAVNQLILIVGFSIDDVVMYLLL